MTILRFDNPSVEQEWQYAVHWVNDEQEYADSKVTQTPEDDDAHTTEEGFDYWGPQIEMYVHRAFTLGLDTPGGRQAAGKAAMTAMSFLEAVVRVYGPLPEPGVSSGGNLENIRPLQDYGDEG